MNPGSALVSAALRETQAPSHTRGVREGNQRGSLQREVCVLLHDEDGQPFLLVQFSDDSEELRDEHGRESERRLV